MFVSKHRNHKKIAKILSQKHSFKEFYHLICFYYFFLKVWHPIIKEKKTAGKFLSVNSWGKNLRL